MIWISFDHTSWDRASSLACANLLGPGAGQAHQAIYRKATAQLLDGGDGDGETLGRAPYQVWFLAVGAVVVCQCFFITTGDPH